MKNLPVINKCGECGWFRPDFDGAYGGEPPRCNHELAFRIVPDPELHPNIRPTDRYRIQLETNENRIPPYWCPLRKNK